MSTLTDATEHWLIQRGVSESEAPVLAHQLINRLANTVAVEAARGFYASVVIRSRLEAVERRRETDKRAKAEKRRLAKLADIEIH